VDAQSFEALERRVAILEARDDIERMHHVYVRAVADREFDSLGDWFTDDAVIDMRFHGAKQGRAAISEHFSHMVETPLDGASYFVTSPVIVVEPDAQTATGTWTWHRLYSTAQVVGRTIPVWGVWEEGRYDCSYRRGEDGTWRFASMTFRIVRPVHDDDYARTLS
jgi:ketosteroid isomerase-like protein